MPITDVTDVVRTLPGVTEQGGNLHLRGGRSGEEMYLVDGASVTNAVMGGEAIPVNPGMIGELQLITGTFNAEYGQAMSGLFNTVLREPADGLSASFGYRTTLGQDYFKTDKGAFKNADVYSESMEIVDDAGNYTDAVEGTDYSKADFGGLWISAPDGEAGPWAFSFPSVSWMIKEGSRVLKMTIQICRQS